MDSITGYETLPTAQGGIVDLTELSTRWNKVSPELKREIMGGDKQAKEFGAILERFGVAKKSTETLGDFEAATPEQLTQLVNDVQSGDSKVASKKFGDSIAKESARRRDYFNEVTKNIRSGNLGKVTTDPARFVDDFLFASDDPAVVTQAMRQLTPETRSQVQQQAAKRLFQEAGSIEASTLKQITAGEPVISSEKLVNVLVKNPKRRAVVDVLIPEADKQLISNYIKYRRGIDQAYRAGGSQGLVAAQMKFGSGSLNGGVMSLIPAMGEAFIKSRVWRWVADAFFSDTGRKAMTEVVQNDRFVPVALAVAARIKLQNATSGLNIPTFNRQSQMEVASQFGAAAVNDYIQRKQRIDQLIGQMTPEEQQAMIAEMPEVATPVRVE